jgi:predicted Zn-dependent protease
MKGDFLVCPACGTRNKPKWEFCARCGESLQGVPVGEPALAAKAADVDTDSAGAFPWMTGLGFVAFGALAVAVWAWSQGKNTPAPRPDPAVFTLPTMPQAAPAPPRVGVNEPGKDAFDEGQRLLMKGDRAGAILRLAQAVADAPQNPTYRSVYAKALLAAGSTDDALRQFEVALRLSPDSVGALSDAARALDRSGHGPEAARLYDAILTREPANEQTLRDLSSLHERDGRFDQALPLVRQLAESRPEDLVLRQELGHVLEKTGDARGAAEAYEKVLSEKPDAHVTRGLLAEIHFKQGEKDQAIAIMRDGVTSDAQAPLPHRGLGSLLERTGQYAEAAKEYREYARLAPGTADAKQLEDRADRIERRLAAASPRPPGT